MSKAERISVLWFGTGSMTANVLPAVDREYVQILAFIDERLEKKGTVFHGAPVISLDEIKDYAFEYIFVGARPYRIIADKLHGLCIPYEKIISLDFEEEARLIALRSASFHESFASFMRQTPLLANAINKQILLESDWFNHLQSKSFLTIDTIDADTYVMRIAFEIKGGLEDSLIALAWIKEFYKNSPDKLHIDIFCIEQQVMSALAQPFIRHIYPNNLFSGVTGYDAKFSIEHFVLVKEYSQKTFHSPYLSGVIEKLNAFADRYAKYSNHAPLYNGAWVNFCILRGWNKWDALGASKAFPFSRADYLAPAWPDHVFNVLRQYDLEKKAFITLHAGGDEHLHPHGVEGKIWPPDCWAQFCRLCKRAYPDIPLVQLGSHSAFVIQDTDICLAGKISLHETAVILKQAMLHIDGESGLVHLRRQLRGQSIVLFGPTPEAYYGYPHNRNIISPVCGNCMWTTNDWNTNCPRELPEPECLRAISPKKVLREMESALAERREYTCSVGNVALYSSAERKAYEPVLEDICRVCGVEKQPITKTITGLCHTYIHASKQWEYAYVIKTIETIGAQHLKIADIGSGRGMLSWYLARQGHDVTAYDLNFSHAGGSDLDLNRRFVQFAKAEGFCAEFGSIFNIPMEDNIFDVVTCVSVVEHISWKFYAFKEMFRVLKPGGKLIITYDLTLADREQYDGNRLEVFTLRNIEALMQELSVPEANIHTEEAIQASMNDISNDKVRGIGESLTVGGFVLTKCIP